MFLSLVSTEVVPRRVQPPFTYFTGPWDDFMVHGVDRPLVQDTSQIQIVPIATVLIIYGARMHILFYCPSEDSWSY
jgi:hypothetical protein